MTSQPHKQPHGCHSGGPSTTALSKSASCPATHKCTIAHDLRTTNTNPPTTTPPPPPLHRPGSSKSSAPLPRGLWSQHLPRRMSCPPPPLHCPMPHLNPPPPPPPPALPPVLCTGPGPCTGVPPCTVQRGGGGTIDIPENTNPIIPTPTTMGTSAPLPSAPGQLDCRQVRLFWMFPTTRHPPSDAGVTMGRANEYPKWRFRHFGASSFGPLPLPPPPRRSISCRPLERGASGFSVMHKQSRFETHAINTRVALRICAAHTHRHGGVAPEAKQR